MTHAMFNLRTQTPCAIIYIFAYTDIDTMTLQKPLQDELNAFHAGICSALADTTRIALLYELSDGEMAVGELVQALDAPQATISRHLKVLRDRELVIARRDGSHVYYSLTDGRIIDALDLLRKVMAGILDHRSDLARALTA